MHLKIPNPPVMRIDGVLCHQKNPPLTTIDGLKKLFTTITQLHLETVQIKETLAMLYNEIGY